MIGPNDRLEAYPTLGYSASSNAREKSALRPTCAPRVDGLMHDRLPACLRLPSANFRPPTSFAAHRISPQAGPDRPNDRLEAYPTLGLQRLEQRAPKKRSSTHLRTPR